MRTKDPATEDKLQGVHVLPRGEDICVWMIAKVVNFKLCNHANGCATCPFDEAMTKAWDRKHQEEST